MMDSVRLDKWLWAARFFKTRTLAKEQIDGGKIRVDGVRPKPSRELKGGELIQLRQGFDDMTVEVLALSDQRRTAAEAQKLYAETAESRLCREKSQAERKAANAAITFDAGRPNKKQRRLIHGFKRQILEE